MCSNLNALRGRECSDSYFAKYHAATSFASKNIMRDWVIIQSYPL